MAQSLPEKMRKILVVNAKKLRRYLHFAITRKYFYCAWVYAVEYASAMLPKEKKALRLLSKSRNRIFIDSECISMRYVYYK